MKKYIGNLQQYIDCDNIIRELLQHNVEVNHGHMDLPVDNPFYTESVKQTVMLKNAGYDDNTVEYRHYQSGKHFDNNVVDILSSITNTKPLMCWVSEIRPGKCTPMHWDINPWELEHKELGTIIRYICFLSKPEFGHVFVTDTDCYYLEDQGSIFQYSDIHQWHAGTNIGITPKYVLTFTGIISSEYNGV
jgi:hypothetical protein